MIRRHATALLVLLALAGCFRTETRLVTDGSHDGRLRDGRYQQLCREDDGRARGEPDAVVEIRAVPLPDGRTGVDLIGETTLHAEVMPLPGQPAVTIVAVREDKDPRFENYLVFTQPGIDRAFVTLMLPETVEDRIDSLDDAGDRAGILSAVATAVAAKDYTLMAAYAEAGLVAPDGSMPEALARLAESAGKPLPACR